MPNTSNNILREFIKYIGASTLEMAAISIYIIADTFFISRALGAYGLTALNISIVSFTVVHSFGLLVGIGGGAYFAITKDQGVFGHALALGAFLGGAFVVLGAGFTQPIATALGADATTLPMVVAYTRTLLVFAPFLIFKNILLCFVRNNGMPKAAMAATVVGAVVNIVLDYVFLFPFNMGMFGAALATVLGLGASILVLLKFNTLPLARCPIRWATIQKIATLGVSTFVNELTVAISLIVFNLVALHVAGNVGVAAYGIVMNLAIVVFSFYNGIAFGMQPLVSRGGMGSTPLKYGLVLVAVLSIVVYVPSFLGANAIAGAFNSQGNAALGGLASTGIRIYFAGLVFAGGNIVVSMFFSASGKARQGFWISILRSLLLIVPLLLLFSHIWGMVGVWLSFVATEALVAVVGLCLLVKYWMKPTKKLTPYVLLLMLPLLLAACGSAEEYEYKTQPTTEKTTAATMPEPEPEPETEPEISPQFTTWQAAYAALLTQYMYSPMPAHTPDEANWRFFLHDINQNGTPELFITISHESGHGEYYSIYTFTGYSAVALNFNSVFTDGGFFALQNTPWFVISQLAGSITWYLKMAMEGLDIVV